MLEKDWLCITTLHDWFTDLPPIFHPIVTRSHAFFRALPQFHVIRVLIGSLHGVSILVLRHSVENRLKQELQFENQNLKIKFSNGE